MIQPITTTGCEIWVNEFTEESAKRFREQLLAKSEENKSQPIVIYIDSYGGYVDSLAMMFETMDSVPNKLITVCHGKAMSCGAMLLAHGDIRICGPYSRVMVHEISSGTGGNVKDIITDAKEIESLNEFWMSLLAKDCKIKDGYKGLQRRLKNNGGREIWMDPEAAKKFGVVDHIGRVEIQKNMLFNVILREAGE